MSEDSEDDVVPTTTSGCIPMTEQVWEQILRLYLVTYRGPDDEQYIRRELDGYLVLTRTGRVNVGRFVRYMRKGILDNELKRGGYVVRCNSKTLHLENGRRRWSVSRAENYIFIGSDIRKTDKRLFAEALLQADDEYRASTVNVRFTDE